LRVGGVNELRRVWLTEDIKPIIECDHCDVVIVPYDKLAVISRDITLVL
jgi:hypothetical protein